MTYCWHPKWLTCFSFAYADRHIPVMFRNLEAQWESSNLLFVNVKKLLACQVLMLLPTIMLVTCKSYLNVATEMQLSARVKWVSPVHQGIFYWHPEMQNFHTRSLEISEKGKLETWLKNAPRNSKPAKKKWTKWKVVYLTIYRVSTIQGGSGFLPSTVHSIIKYPKISQLQTSLFTSHLPPFSLTKQLLPGSRHLAVQMPPWKNATCGPYARSRSHPSPWIHGSINPSTALWLVDINGNGP